MPGVTSWSVAAEAEGDGRVESFNFRACLTKNKSNGVPIRPPASGYHPSTYLLYNRWLKAALAKDPSKVARDGVSNFFGCGSYGDEGLCSTNDGPALSINPMGNETYHWPSATAAERYVGRPFAHIFARFALVLLVRVRVALWQSVTHLSVWGASLRSVIVPWVVVREKRSNSGQDRAEVTFNPNFTGLGQAG